MEALFHHLDIAVYASRVPACRGGRECKGPQIHQEDEGEGRFQIEAGNVQVRPEDGWGGKRIRGRNIRLAGIPVPFADMGRGRRGAGNLLRRAHPLYLWASFRQFLSRIQMLTAGD